MSAEKCVICGKVKNVAVYFNLKSGGNAPMCKECHDIWADSDLEWNQELKDFAPLKEKEPCEKNGNTKS